MFKKRGNLGKFPITHINFTKIFFGMCPILKSQLKGGILSE